jgi:hypothetical protein
MTNLSMIRPRVRPSRRIGIMAGSRCMRFGRLGALLSALALMAQALALVLPTAAIAPARAPMSCARAGALTTTRAPSPHPHGMLGLASFADPLFPLGFAARARVAPIHFICSTCGGAARGGAHFPAEPRPTPFAASSTCGFSKH